MDLHTQLSVLQARIQQVADGGIAHATHDATIAMLEDAVTARDRGQWADRMQGTRESAQAQRVMLQPARHQHLRAAFQRRQALV